MGNDKKKALVLFSGGVDSTYVTARSAPFFDKLILNTYKTPGMTRVGASRKSARQLSALFSGKIVHNIIDITDFVNEVRGGVADCVKANIDYGFFYSWCLGCKLAMHLYTIDFCLRDGIAVVLDGSNYYDEHALEQHEDVKDFFTGLYREKGIEFIAPCYRDEGITRSRDWIRSLMRNLSLYKDSTESRVAYLRGVGIEPGGGMMSQYRSCQPSCVTSLLFNLPRVFLKLVFNEKKGNYLAYLKDTVPGK